MIFIRIITRDNTMILLNDYLLVKKIKQEDEGIVFASAINTLIGEGELIQAPEGSELPLGAKIYFEKSLGTEFKINGEECKFIKLEDIMGYE